MALGESLKSRIRSAYATPGARWFAGCAGFLIAEWVHRPVDSEPSQDGEQSSASTRRSGTAVISNAVLLLRMLWAKAQPLIAPAPADVA